MEICQSWSNLEVHFFFAGLLQESNLQYATVAGVAMEKWSRLAASMHHSLPQFNGKLMNLDPANSWIPWQDLFLPGEMNRILQAVWKSDLDQVVLEIPQEGSCKDSEPGPWRLVLHQMETIAEVVDATINSHDLTRETVVDGAAKGKIKFQVRNS